MACDSEYLSKLKIAQSKLADILMSDPGAEEYEIRGRRVNRGDLIKKARNLREEIDFLEAQFSRLANGRARTTYNLVNP